MFFFANGPIMHAANLSNFQLLVDTKAFRFIKYQFILVLYYN